MTPCTRQKGCRTSKARALPFGDQWGWTPIESAEVTRTFNSVIFLRAAHDGTSFAPAGAPARSCCAPAGAGGRRQANAATIVVPARRKTQDPLKITDLSASAFMLPLAVLPSACRHKVDTHQSLLGAQIRVLPTCTILRIKTFAVKQTGQSGLRIAVSVGDLGLKATAQEQHDAPLPQQDARSLSRTEYFLARASAIHRPQGFFVRRHQPNAPSNAIQSRTCNTCAQSTHIRPAAGRCRCRIGEGDGRVDRGPV